MTKKRQQILDLLKKGRALSAAQIFSALPEIDLVTIYRNLDLFAKDGMVKKYSFGDEALYEYQNHPHHHAVCTVCGKVIHFDVSEQQLTKLIKVPTFSIDFIDVTVTGVCCRK